MSKSKRTTLTLEPDVERRLRSEMRRRRAPFKAVVNEVLRTGLNCVEKSAEQGPFVVEAEDLGNVSGLDYDNISELLETIEDHK